MFNLNKISRKRGFLESKTVAKHICMEYFANKLCISPFALLSNKVHLPDWSSRNLLSSSFLVNFPQFFKPEKQNIGITIFLLLSLQNVPCVYTR